MIKDEVRSHFLERVLSKLLHGELYRRRDICPAQIDYSLSYHVLTHLAKLGTTSLN